LNFATEKATGFDIETTYALPLEEVDEGWKGDLNLQMLITHAMSDVQNSGAPGTIPIDIVGENATAAAPHWKYQGTLQYHLDPVAFGLTLRGISPGKINSNYITCTAGCPVSTANNITTDYNKIAGAWYVDLNSSYMISPSVEMYFNVKNLFNLNPPVYYVGPNNNSWQSIPAPLYNYDLLGRVYRLGVRFNM
jgi:outer membrane receptor protein involved in Fe transport